MKIEISLAYDDGLRKHAAASGPAVTEIMQVIAEELFEVCSTGRPLKDLYGLVATAFNVPREEAKLRLLGAAYGKVGKP